MPLLPNRERAVIDPEKISGYLLDREHPEGGPKALFFFAVGFAAERAEDLAAALLAHTEEPVSSTSETTFGVKYVIDGPFRASGGRTRMLRSVWIVDEGEDRPRFVTAYPLEEQA